MDRAFARLAALTLLAAAPPAAPGAELELTAEVAPGIDTNPSRVTGPAGSGEGFASALLGLRGRLDGERGRLDAALSGAGRLYPGASPASAVAGRLELGGRMALADHLSAGVAMTASDLTEKAGRLDQDALRGEASLALAGRRASAELALGFAAFAPRDEGLRPFAASGPEAAVRAALAPAAGHLVSAGYALWAAGYPRWPGFAGQPRDDRTHTLSLEYAFRGPFLAAVGFSHAWNLSSAPGGAFRRARLSARAAAPLPGAFALAARASLQWSTYPDAAFLQEQLLLSEGRESLNALELRLTRPLSGALDAVLALALHGGETVSAPGLAPSFSRTVFTLGVAWRTALIGEP